MSVNNWIFVTGAPRSGTTFVGKMLSTPLSVDYIHEPFNPDCGIPGINDRYLYRRDTSANDGIDRSIASIFRYDFHLRTGFYQNDTRLNKMIKRLIGSRGPFYLRLAKINPFHTTAIIKDPIGCLLTEYLANDFKVKPIILLRHPVAFVSSIMRIGWKINLEPILSQRELVNNYLSSEYRMLQRKGVDNIESAALLWRCLNKVLLIQYNRHPEWKLITHENLSREPIPVFKNLFDYAEVPWSKRIENRIARMTSRRNLAEPRKAKVQDFKRDSAMINSIRHATISRADRKRIFDLTHDISADYYAKDTFNIEDTELP